MESDAVEIEEGEEPEYEIEAILSHRIRRGVVHYLVTWTGYDSSHNQYLPEEAFENAQRLLRSYKRQNNLQ